MEARGEIMPEPDVVVEHLSFTYPDGTQALKDVNFTVRKGEFVVLSGPNGAGKSTLCYSMNGVIPNIIGGQMKGNVRVAGLDTSKSAVYEISRKVGTMLQNAEAQIFCTSVKEEIVCGPEFLGFPRERILENFKRVLQIVRLEGTEERSPRELSGGQKQRLVLASIFSMEPSILVLDEPTSQLDPIGTKQVLSVIRKLKEEKDVTVIMAEHKSEEIVELADRIILLNEGRVVAEGDPYSIYKNEQLLKEIYVPPPEVTMLSYKLKNAGKIERVALTLDETRKMLSELAGMQRAFEADSGERSAYVSEDTGKYILEARNVSYRYPGDVQALRNVNARFSKGEFVAIIGQNGSGKTTLVKLLIGLLKPTEGTVLIDGEDSTKLTVGQISKKVGMVLQNPDNQLFALTVEEEVQFGTRNIGLSHDEVDKKTQEALKLVGLEAQRKAYPFNLSMSDRRKLTVAAVWAMNPNVLILDEPTTGQDYKGRYEIMEIAKSLNRAGHTIIVITHDIDLVAAYAKRVIVLGKGEVLLDGPAREVLSKTETLDQTFLQPPQITRLGLALGMPHPPLTVDEMWSRLALYAHAAPSVN
jgi:energy-coupling factor transport system ATP-binding protein